MESIKEAHQLLAQIDAETQHEESKLADLRTAGADHFRGQLADQVPTLTEENLDEWSGQAGAAAAVADQASLS